MTQRGDEQIAFVENPTFDRIVEAARELGWNYIKITMESSGSGCISPGCRTQGVHWPATDKPGKAALEALEAEIAKRKPKEPEPPGSDELLKLREIARDNGWMKTADGKWVRGNDKVFRRCDGGLTSIPACMARRDVPWYSTWEAAKEATKGKG